MLVELELTTVEWTFVLSIDQNQPKLSMGNLPIISELSNTAEIFFEF